MVAIRRQCLVYCGLILFCLWTIGTYYLVGNAGGFSMPTIEDRVLNLEAQINKVEEAVRVQRADHQLLLGALKQRSNVSQSLLESAAGASDGSASFLSAPDEPIAVLVFACNRSKAIANHLQQLIKLRPSPQKFPIVVTQDCDDEDTTNTVLSFGSAVKLIHQPDQREIQVPKKWKKFKGYYKIARHYKWALNETFYNMNYSTVIITEDDIDISVDFFEYFTATYPLLHVDPTLMCVSAWNDNGKANLIERNPSMLWRTDFFPGLGWMLTKRLWDELSVKWPEAFWDDWLRNPEQRQMRSCIRPEVPRTAMSPHGKVGVSKGLFFEKHLKHIALNREFVKFTELDLSYLLRDKYDPYFMNRVYSAPSITQPELRAGALTSGQPLPEAVRLTYEERHTYKSTAKAFSLMDDFRAGVPRMAYRGVVAFMYGPTRVYLAPPATWTNYDPTWN